LEEIPKIPVGKIVMSEDEYLSHFKDGKFDRTHFRNLAINITLDASVVEQEEVGPRLQDYPLCAEIAGYMATYPFTQKHTMMVDAIEGVIEIHLVFGKSSRKRPLH
jgi:hypothetical protein